MKLSLPTLQNRNFGLDVVRALSILLVLIAHTARFENLELGVLGVEIFFVLSGFLIGQILIRDFSDGITFSKMMHFWKRRWFRTLPLYYSIILVKFLFIDSSLGKDVLVYFFFLQNNFVGIQFFEVSWSLVIEEWFYLCTPIALYFLFRKGLEPHKLLYLFVAGIAIAMVARIAWVSYSNVPFGGIRGNFPFRFDSLIFGLLLANTKMNYRALYNKLNNRFVFLFGLGLVITLIWLLGNVSRADAYANTSLWTRSAWFSLMSFGIFLALPWFENSVTMDKIKKVKPLFWLFSWTSIITYSIYLTHTFTLDVYGSYTRHLDLSLSLNYLLEYLVVFTVSFLVFVFCEYPATRLRDVL